MRGWFTRASIFPGGSCTEICGANDSNERITLDLMVESILEIFTGVQKAREIPERKSIAW